jgi:two-component system, NtrC family, sensor kinase
MGHGEAANPARFYTAPMRRPDPAPDLELANRLQQLVSRVSSSPHVRLGELAPLCKLITEEVARQLGIERVSVWFFNEQKDALILQDLYLLSRDQHEHEGVIAQEAFGQEFQFLLTEKYVDAHDPYNDPRTAGYADAYLRPCGITSMLDAVIRMGEELVGALCLEHVGEAHRWDEREITLASQLGDQISLALAMARVRCAEADLRALNADLAARVQQRSEELQQAREALLAAERGASLGKVLAHVAHEVNTPIGNARLAATTLQGQAQALLQQIETGQIGRRMLCNALRQQEKAAQLLDHNLALAAERVLTLKSVAADQASGARRRFLLAGMVQDLVELMGAGLRRTACAVRWQFDIDPGIEMDSFPGPLGQALVVLIDNALLHAFEGRQQGCLTLSARQVDGERVHLRVADDGVGIPHSERERVFDPFVSSKFGCGGSGLGLTIARQIVQEQLGGRLALETDAVPGCTFLFDLPLIAP